MAARLTEEQVHTKIKIKHGDKLVMTSPYKNSKEPTSFECNICTHQWITSPMSVMRGSGCSKCADKRSTELRKVKEEDVHIRIEKEHNDKLRMTGGYEAVGQPANFKCNVCSHEWTTTTYSVLRGTGCSKCADKAKNKNQDSLTQYFKDHLLGVELLSNHHPEFLKTKQNPKGLELDFYWPDLQIALELDGAQHYEPVDYWGGQETFERVQANDRRKNQLCKKNGVHLIRVDGRKFYHRLIEEKRAEMFNEMLTEIVHVAHSRGLIGTTL